MGTTSLAVPISGRYSFQPHALEVIGSIASVANDAGCALTAKRFFASGAWSVLQQHLTWSLHRSKRGRGSGDGGVTINHSHRGIAIQIAISPISFESLQRKFQLLPIHHNGSIRLPASAETVGIVVYTSSSVLDLIIVVGEQ